MPQGLEDKWEERAFLGEEGEYGSESRRIGRAKKKKRSKSDPRGVTGDGGVGSDADDGSEKVGRTERIKDTETLDVLVQAEADKGKMTPIQPLETVVMTNSEVLDKEKLRINEESAFVNPVPALRVLGNIPMNDSMRQHLGDLRFGKDERLSAIRSLISRGYNLNGIGVEMRPHESGGIVYSKDLGRIEEQLIQSLIEELQRQSENYDIVAMSKELRVFLGDNLEKFYIWVGLYGDMRKELDKKKVSEKRQSTTETETNENLVWYDGILKDILKATVFGAEPKRSEEIRNNLVSRGDDIPSISFDLKMTQAYENRQWLRNAVEILLSEKEIRFPYREERTPVKWESKEQIVDWLKRMKIGEGGVPYLSGSEEAKRRGEVGKLETETEAPLVDWKDMIKIDPVLAGLARESGARWAELQVELDKLSPDERTAQLKALKVLQQIRSNIHLLKTYPNIKAYWDRHRTVLTERLGIKLPDGV